MGPLTIVRPSHPKPLNLALDAGERDLAAEATRGRSGCGKAVHAAEPAGGHLLRDYGLDSALGKHRRLQPRS
jgi:hypothetical protein